MTMKNKLLILGLLVFTMSIVNAQLPINMDTDTTIFEIKEVVSGARVKKATKLYKHLGYKASIDMYSDLNKKGRLTKSHMNMIADSYRLNGDSENAEFWYAMFVKEAQKDIKILYYAQALLSNNKCEEAIKWFNVYASNNREEAKKVNFIESCEELPKFQSRNIDLINVKALNSESLDFSPVPYKDGIVFTSSRGLKKRISKHWDLWTKDNFTDLFFSKKDENGFFTAPIALKGNSNRKFHDGVATFNQGGTVMYFSRNDETGKSEADEVNLKLYSSTITSAGVWGNKKELPFNSHEYSNCHPTLSLDGTRLYFASDRPGGFGGMDIWVAVMDNGKWIEPVNLGNTVNSSENELFPQIGEDNVLYFASNGHEGFGGLDVYAVKKADNIDETSWEKRTNIGKPFNSNKDDFGFNMDANHQKGFITTNRSGGLGKDDIYNWNSEEPVNFFKVVDEKPFDVPVVVLDKNTAKPINQVVVIVKPMEGMENVTYKTDRKGVASISVKIPDEYRIEFQKDGYQSVVKTVSSVELMVLKGKAFEVDMDKVWGANFTGSMLNSKSNDPLTGGVVKITNLCNGKVSKVKTDRNGKFNYFMECGCDFEIEGSKKNMITRKIVISTKTGDCRSQVIESKLSLVSKPTTKTIISKPAAAIVEKITGNKETLKVGQVIRLDKLYYDYNAAAIRSDAQVELDHLVDLLNTYPSLEIELGSHTDSRGAAEYNQDLSSRRASAAVSYLIKKGIDQSRLKAIGYGENVLTNDCGDGVPCSEQQHQQNRRTEIKITRLDNKNVKIID